MWEHNPFHKLWTCTIQQQNWSGWAQLTLTHFYCWTTSCVLVCWRTIHSFVQREAHANRRTSALVTLGTMAYVGQLRKWPDTWKKSELFSVSHMYRDSNPCTSLLLDQCCSTSSVRLSWWWIINWNNKHWIEIFLSYNKFSFVSPIQSNFFWWLTGHSSFFGYLHWWIGFVIRNRQGVE